MINKLGVKMKFKINLTVVAVLASMNVFAAQEQNKLNTEADKGTIISDIIFKNKEISLDEFNKLKDYLIENPYSKEKKIIFLVNCRKYSKDKKIIRDTLCDFMKSRLSEAPFDLKRDLSEDDKSILTILSLEEIKKFPNDTELLWSTANLLDDNNRKLAIEILEKGKKFDVNNAKWAEKLGHLYSLNDKKHLSYLNYKEAYDKDSKTNKKKDYYLATDVARAAYYDGKYDESKKYAQLALKVKLSKDQGFGLNNDVIFRGNDILGLIALKEKNLDLACKYLLKSSEIGGSPVMSSFGPQMDLAFKLLEKGKKDIVIKFLENCSKFWNEKLCKKWIKSIKEGKYPDLRKKFVMGAMEGMQETLNKQFAGMTNNLTKQFGGMNKELKKSMRMTDIIIQAEDLSPAEFKKLENYLKTNKGSLENRVTFLAYCNYHKIKHDKVGEIIINLVKNEPKCNFFMYGYPNSMIDLISENYISKITKLWSDHIKKSPKDIDLLWCASNCLKDSNPNSTIKFLEQGKKLEPENAKWYSELGSLYCFKNNRLAYENYKIAYKLEKALFKKNHMLIYLADLAYMNKDFNAAKKYANQIINSKMKKNMLFASTNNNAIFNANTILGLLALKDNDTQKASEYLLASSKTTGSPVLGSFGPDMKLAKKLLLKGKKEPVIKFLENCSIFWKKDVCQKWIQEIKDGKNPDFGYN